QDTTTSHYVMEKFESPASPPPPSTMHSWGGLSINLWLTLPIEIRSQIIQDAGPLTLFLNNMLTESDIEKYGEQIWLDAFDVNWTGDFSILPQSHFPTTHHGLSKVRSKTIYKKLCQLRPDLATPSVDQSSESKNTDFKKTFWLYSIEKEEYEFYGWRWVDNRRKEMERNLIHTVMRNNWIDELPEWMLKKEDEDDEGELYRLSALAGWFGHLEFLKWLIIEICKDMQTDEFLMATLQFCLDGACRNGYLEMVQYLFTFDGVFINDGEHRRIRAAAMRNHIDIVKWILEFSTDELEEQKLQALSGACQGGHLELVKYLLSQGIPTSSYEHIPSALVFACEKGNVEIVKLLLESGAARSNSFEAKHQAFLKACESGHLEVIKHLLTLGGIDTTIQKKKAFATAVMKGNLDLLKFLLSVTPQPPNRLIPRHVFKLVGNKENTKMIEYLLTIEGLDPSVDDWVAIREAAWHGHIEVIKLLLNDHRFDPDTFDNRPIIEAVSAGHVDIVKLLLKVPTVDVAVGDSYLFRMAVRQGHLDIVTLLLEDGRSDPTASDNEAIRLASAFGFLDIVKLLLEIDGVDAGASYNHAILSAADYGHVEIVKVLVIRKDVDATTERNQALKKAAERGHLEVVRVLLGVDGVDPHADDDEALRLASQNGHMSVVELLKGEN
ncbi:hypothetical protein HDU76_012399, partial [Blyttiomyces sp. JEL0837]